MAMGLTNSAGVVGYNALSALEAANEVKGTTNEIKGTVNEIKGVLIGDGSEEGIPSIAKSLESMAGSLTTLAENAAIRFANDQDIQKMIEKFFGDKGKTQEI